MLVRDGASNTIETVTANEKESSFIRCSKKMCTEILCALYQYGKVRPWYVRHTCTIIAGGEHGPSFTVNCDQL